MVAEAQNGICSSQMACFGSKNVHFDWKKQRCFHACWMQQYIKNKCLFSSQMILLLPKNHFD